MSCSPTRLQRSSGSQANGLHNKSLFQHLSLKSIEYKELSTEVSMGFQPSPQHPPCCVATWLLTDLTVFTGFDRGGGREKKFFHKTTPSQKTKSLGTTAKNFNPTCTNSTITRSKIQADTPHFTLSFYILVWPWKMERIYNAKEFKYCITFLHHACLLVPKS